MPLTSSTARYDLDAADLRRIAAAVLADSRTSRGRFVCVVAGPDEPLADLARTVERQVFEESFGNDAATMTAEYAAYEQRSLFFVVLDRRAGRPAGVSRIIQAAGGPRVKTLDDAPAYLGRPADAIIAAHGLADGGTIWDFATIAVLSAYRGGRSALTVSSLLYRTFILAGEAAGAKHVVTMLDGRAYRNLRLLGVPLVALAASEPFAYLGSAENHALYADFAAIRPSIAEQAARLRRPGRAGTREIRARGWRGLLVRRIAAGVSRRVATGKGLDKHILLSR